MQNDSPWLYEIQRRSREHDLGPGGDDLFISDTPYFPRAFQDRNGFYFIGLKNGHVWRCTGLRLSNVDGTVVRLLGPKLLSPAVESNILQGTDILVSDVSWFADSEDPLNPRLS